jgi:phage baseplate assembly protein W
MPRPPAFVVAPAIGWPLLPRPDADGRLNWPDLAASVAAQLRVLLATRPGELLNHPEFGAGLQEFLHEPDTLATRARIKERIEQALARFEPRITVDAVEVWSAAHAPGIARDVELGQVRIEIQYRLRRTGQMQRTGLTLELGG